MLLPEQVVKIVIALISLSFLIYLLAALYFSGSDLENQEKAEDYLIRSTNSLKSFIQSNLSKGQVEFLNPAVPNGWHLFSFTGKSEKPTKCEGKNCLCICSNEWWGQEKECHETGSCLIVENLKEGNIEIKLTVNPSVTIIVKEVNNLIEVSKKE